jgi:four helix bundle protein
MSRDPRKLRVFQKADAAVLQVYRATRRFPIEERYGLQTQVRKAAVSCAANLVEGSARQTTAEYVHFVNISAGSGAEARYLIDLAQRLAFVTTEERDMLVSEYSEILAGLQSLIASLANQP